MKAYVLPADLTQPGRIVEWHNHAELLSLMYAEIGTDCVDHGRAVYPEGEVTIWVDDTGLVGPHPEFNDHAIGIARCGGWNVAALAGTVFITGGCDASGGTLGLPEPLLHRIDTTIRTVRDLPAGGGGA